MPVKVVIKRKFKALDIQQVSPLLIQARSYAIQEEGYLASETLRSMDNPNEIVVLSMWEKKSDWERFKGSPSRKELEGIFAPMLETPTECTVYKMGLTT